MSNIKTEIIRGAWWSAIEKYSSLFVNIIISMILARILSPKEFGVVAIATVLINFLQMFSSMGLAPAIIQRRDLNHQDLNNIYTMSLFIGSILAVLFFCSSWSIATFYNNVQLIPICQILSLNLFMGAANMVPNALMQKNKRFKLLAQRTLSLQLVSGVISVFAAYKGAGVFALLISPIVTSIGVFFYNRRYYPVNISRKFTIKPIKRVFSFSIYSFLFEFINYFSRNLDKLIIGKYLTVADLGYYEKSYRLMQMPMYQLTGVINPVLQPVMSTLQNDMEQMAQKYEKIIRFIATLSFPIGVTLFMTGYEIITLFYGVKWNGAVSSFQILCLSIPTQLVLSTTGGIFFACNKSNHLFYAGLRNTMFTVVGFVIAAIYYRTLESFALAWTLTSYVNFFSSFIDMYANIFKRSLIKLLAEMIRPMIGAFVIVIVLYFVDRYVSLNILLFVIVKIAIAGVLAILFTQLLGQYDLFALIKSYYKKNN